MVQNRKYNVPSFVERQIKRTQKIFILAEAVSGKTYTRNWVSKGSKVLWGRRDRKYTSHFIHFSMLSSTIYYRQTPQINIINPNIKIMYTIANILLKDDHRKSKVYTSHSLFSSTA